LSKLAAGRFKSKLDALDIIRLDISCLVHWHFAAQRRIFSYPAAQCDYDVYCAVRCFRGRTKALTKREDFLVCLSIPSHINPPISLFLGIVVRNSRCILSFIAGNNFAFHPSNSLRFNLFLSLAT
jgi:hypothetical protein